MDNKQRLVSRLIAKAGQLLLGHGAESAVAVDIMHRLGLASGADEVEVSISANAIVITTFFENKCMTTTRQVSDKGINMRVVSEIQHICISLEQAKLDYLKAQIKLDDISPNRYNRWLVAVMIGLSCAAFGRLAGAAWDICAVTFIASAIGMLVRQEIAHRHFNPLINFSITAFVTTLISSQAVIFEIGDQPTIAMAASVLMLVPGFPLINAAADMVNGYINMAIARFVMASLLTFATALGIVGAMSVVNVWAWI